MAIGVGALVIAVVGGVVYAAVRGGDDETAFVQPFTAPVEAIDTVVDEPTESVSEADPEEELYSHIPSDVPSDTCEHDAQTPDSAVAGVLCELGDQDLFVQYWLFADSESMYESYDEYVTGGDQVVDGDCPDEAPSETGWVQGGGARKGRYACYVIPLTKGDDAHVIWTYDDLLILSELSHVSVNSDTGALMDFWADSAGPE